jgi:glycogen debranching enzyme
MADPSPSSVRGPQLAHFALKHDFAFLIADGLGDVTGGRDGLFVNDTRVLSQFTLALGGAAPSLLGSGVSQDNVFFTANLTNRPLPELGGYAPPEGVVHVERQRFLWEARIYECLVLTNYGERTVKLSLGLHFAADYADIFEVRGLTRRKRGERIGPQLGRASVTLGYRGLDEVLRRTCIAFSQTPHELSVDAARFDLELARDERFSLYVEIGTEPAEAPSRERFRTAAARARSGMRAKRRRGARMSTAGRLFDTWLDKARADLALLETDLPTGPYPFAGIPWFSTPFGRDAIVTALQTLWLDPGLARGVLAFLARNQAHERSAFADSAPGKILHEMRRGEMANLHEVPFGRYYGGVDTTPLFVMLAGAYAQRTGDAEFIEQLWPALCLAMQWVEGAGDSNGDGFVDYQRGAASGLANQGWKDSVDSVFHADGHIPDGPIALVEVQGFAYAASLAMADLAQRRGDTTREQHWRTRARALQRAVEDRFWMPELRTYGIALDGEDKLCRVLTSNAGQLLYSGLPAPERAQQVIEQLLRARFDNGWGIRTLAAGQPRYNPMSYHDGSVWPHDTGLCAAGMARYGDRAQAAHVLGELFAAAMHFGMRLPELFCGFPRHAGEPPVGYPVACLPQAWSSGTPFMLLQACLGVQVDGWRREVHIDRPTLPEAMGSLHVRGLAVGDAQVDLVFECRSGRTTAAAVGRVPDGVKLMVHL